MSRPTGPVDIALADLTHVGQMVAANTFPLGASIVAARTIQEFGARVRVGLFRYPAEFAEYLSRGIPPVVGFSNFLWNKSLSYEFARRIKQAAPQTVVVFGGPNYPTEPGEQAAFLAAHPAVDFHVYKEGEIAFKELLDVLFESGFDAGAAKRSGRLVPGVHYLRDGEIVCGPLPPRIRDLTETASPLLTGLCDRFFDGVLIPMIETNRGCPFTCTFCIEGGAYHNKVGRSMRERIDSELDYVAERVRVPDILISDSNFGMYKEDLDTCRKLAELRRTRGWPKYVLNSSGKNQKERVLDAARLLDGALVLTASIQSADPVVLANIKRSNISLPQIVAVAKDAEQLGANSYSEIILAMPGDTREAHMRSVSGLMDAGLAYVMTYQMLMLPGAESSSAGERRRFGMDTRFRISPRNFGHYELLGEAFSVAETEEICVATSSLGFEEYLDCRAYNLTVQLFYNGGAFRELLAFLRRHDVSASAFVNRVHAIIAGEETPLRRYYEDYRDENVNKLWQRREELDAYVRRPDVVDRLLSGELGSSEIDKYRGIVFYSHQREMHALAFRAARELLGEAQRLDAAAAAYLEDLEVFSALRKEHLNETARDYTESFGFDFVALSKAMFEADPFDHARPERIPIRIFHDREQQELIAAYLLQYGSSINGLGRILARTNVRTLYRRSDYAGAPSSSA